MICRIHCPCVDEQFWDSGNVRNIFIVLWHNMFMSKICKTSCVNLVKNVFTCDKCTCIDNVAIQLYMYRLCLLSTPSMFWMQALYVLSNRYHRSFYCYLLCASKLLKENWSIYCLDSNTYMTYTSVLIENKGYRIYLGRELKTAKRNWIYNYKDKETKQHSPC